MPKEFIDYIVNKSYSNMDGKSEKLIEENEPTLDELTSNTMIILLIFNYSHMTTFVGNDDIVVRAETKGLGRRTRDRSVLKTIERKN